MQRSFNFDIDVIIDGDDDTHFYAGFMPKLIKAAKRHNVLIGVKTWQGEGGGWPTFTLKGKRAAIAMVINDAYDANDAKMLLELLIDA